MSDSVRPHRQQPIRLPRPWDSPGKNTGVGCHFLLQCMKVKSESEVAQSCLTLRDPMDRSLPGSSAHGIFQARVLERGAIAFSISMIAPCIINCLTCFVSAQVNKLQHAVPVQQGYTKLQPTMENTTHPKMDSTIRTMGLRLARGGGPMPLTIRVQ